ARAARRLRGGGRVGRVALAGRVPRADAGGGRLAGGDAPGLQPRHRHDRHRRPRRRGGGRGGRDPRGRRDLDRRRGAGGGDGRAVRRAVSDSKGSAFTLAEAEAMRHALDLARRGWGRVAPSPVVGAVVLRGDAVVGEGWHAEFGGPHAEVAALASAGRRARGGSLVVTLEPCAHSGKTPPCTDAILAAGVRRVVAAIRDPDPQAGGGLDVLRRRGVAVEEGVLAEEAAALNAPFLFAREQRQRPFVALKLATSIDGRIADSGGRSEWVSGPEARDYVHWLRAGFDAIAVGGTTALRDNPRLTVRGSVVPRRPPLRILF